MEICVCIKRVPLLGSSIVLTDDALAIDTKRLGFTLSPHEECAVEAAVQLVEQHGGSITLLCLGSAEAEEQLREQLAIGADRAILLQADADEADPQATAELLAEAILAEDRQFDLILLGSESADTAGYQTGIRLAHRLGRPIITNAKGLTVSDGQVTCERAVGSTREVYRAPLPAIVTTKDGLNIPRYPSVPGRIKARKKPVDIKEVTVPAARLRKQRLVVPPSQAKGAEDLGTGATAAAGIVDVMRQIGVLT
jgi:electron transfer flavoprotein beta subunit